MPVKFLLLGKVLSSIFNAQKEVANNIEKFAALSKLKEEFRIKFITHFTQKFTEEMEYNLKEYVKKISEISAEGQIARRDIETLNFKFSKLIYNYTQIVEREFDTESHPILEQIEQKYGKKEIVSRAPKQKFPVLAWINQNVSPPAKIQPFMIQETDLEPILQKLLNLYDNIELENL